MYISKPWLMPYALDPDGDKYCKIFLKPIKSILFVASLKMIDVGVLNECMRHFLSRSLWLWM